LHALQQKYARAHHDLLQRKSDELLDRRALEMEAAARGVGTDVVLKGLLAPVVTDDDVRNFYEANKGQTTQSYEGAAPQIRRYLSTLRDDAATHDFYADLRSRHGIRSYLTPYRVKVAASGPARGPSTAAVTIVEFADFQCPYCKQAEGTLRTLLARHPQNVRLVFRNLPLAPLHPNAEISATAGVCADRLGKFWEMHDAMYADQGALGRDALVETARRLGLDGDRFSTCLTDRATRQALDDDASAALELGLGSTPYFFIDGRPLDGSVPLEKFESIIAEELGGEQPAEKTAHIQH
jgi:protein-disulfide isomerase